MEIEELNQLIDEKKWKLLHQKLELKLSTRESVEDDESLIQIFENMDREYRDQYAANLYLVMWKIAFKSGKIKLAKNYIETLLDHLIEYKRVPTLRKLIFELSQEGLLQQNKKIKMIDTILGKKNQSTLDMFYSYEYHPEMWKNSKNILKNFLIEKNEWNIDSWKLAYEFILKFYYDKEIFLILAERTFDLGKNNHYEHFKSFLISKKISLKAIENKPSQMMKIKYKSLDVDYDQIAMDVISGVREPSIAEQRRILISIQEINEEELKAKGKDMIIAFGLLGMDRVVIRLCERLLPLLTEVNLRAGIQFMLAQAYYESNEHYKVCDLIDDTFNSEPLLQDEVIAFKYLKAESLMKLRKYKMAKEIFLNIKKYNPRYRLVGERLRELEEFK